MIVRPSAVVLSTAGVTERGVYSSRALRRGEKVARFDGPTVGKYESRKEAERAALTCGLDRTRLVVVWRGRGVFHLLDVSGTLPSFINDTRGTGLGPNVRVTERGDVVVLAHISPYDGSIRSELRCRYGREFWKAKK